MQRLLTVIGRRSKYAWTVLLLVVSTDARAQPYTAIDLGVLPGQTSSVATDINDRFQVVGYSGDQAFLWEPTGTGLRRVGVTAWGDLFIDNSGVIAGMRLVDGRPRPFAWVDGEVYDLPMPPGETVWDVRSLTDNGILLMGGNRYWALLSGVLYDLNALTGASIIAINEMTMLGGTANGHAYLRYPDGRVIRPWMPPFGGGSVDIIGPAGHFAGHAGFEAYYGSPDGRIAPMGLSGPRGGFTFNGINRPGEVVGTYRFDLISSPVGFTYRNGRVVVLGTAIVSGPSQINAAYGINDAGYVAGSAIVNGTPRAVVLVPTVPAAPTGLFHSVTGSIVTLVWQASVGAVDYIVEAGSVPGARDLCNAAIGTEPSLITPAPPGRYYVRVRARNRVGVSEPSAEIVIDVP